jgi:hypothetical protein
MSTLRSLARIIHQPLGVSPWFLSSSHEPAVLGYSLSCAISACNVILEWWTIAPALYYKRSISLRFAQISNENHTGFDYQNVPAMLGFSGERTLLSFL